MSKSENQIIRPYGDAGSRQHSDEKYQRTAAQGTHLSAIRNKAGMSYYALARSAGIAPQDLLAIEAGILDLSPQLAKQIAEVLGIRFSELWLCRVSKRRAI